MFPFLLLGMAGLLIFYPIYIAVLWASGRDTAEAITDFQDIISSTLSNLWEVPVSIAR
jgi:hypothetical protein